MFKRLKRFIDRTKVIIPKVWDHSKFTWFGYNFHGSDDPIKAKIYHEEMLIALKHAKRRYAAKLAVSKRKRDKEGHLI